MKEKLLSWLYTDPGLTPVIRRLVGLLFLAIVPLIFFWTHGGPGPYTVPAWRIGDVLLRVPAAPAVADLFLWAVYCGCALAVIFTQRKLPMVGCLVLLAYFTSLDLMAANCSYVVLVFTYGVALLFANQQRNCSRRLIQISVSLCYLHSAIYKMISPDWASGQTFSWMFSTAYDLRPLVAQSIA